MPSLLIAEQQPPPPIDGARFGSGSLLLDGPLDQQVRSLAASMTRRVQTKARHIPSGVLSQQPQVCEAPRTFQLSINLRDMWKPHCTSQETVYFFKQQKLTSASPCLQNK